MKHNKTNLFTLLIILIMIMSCEKEAVNEEELVVVIEETEEVVNSETTEETQDCGDFTSESLQLSPVCSFNPIAHPEVHFPMRVLYNGMITTRDDYDFLWSNSSESSAISSSYSDLPVSVIITQKTTNCSIELSIEASYWD